MPTAGSSRPASSIRTPTCCSGARARASWSCASGAPGYLEILAAGGGILSTVAATRAASQRAARGARPPLARRDVRATASRPSRPSPATAWTSPTELRLLEVAYELGREGPVDVVPTWLGAHAVPPEFRSRPDAAEAYVRHLVDVQLPGVAAQGRARSCDAFCEQGVFTAEQCRRVLEAAVGYGMSLRVHADELAPSGGAELAVELGALSADHLHSPSDAGVAAMAAAAVSGSPVVATLLPATSWFLMEDEPAPGRRFIDAGVPVALGTDFNPGTSPVANLPLAMSFACLGMRLTPAEALAGVTINAAHAVGVADEVGSIEPGKAADLVVWRAASVEQLPYWAGREPRRGRDQARPDRPPPRGLAEARAPGRSWLRASATTRSSCAAW